MTFFSVVFSVYFNFFTFFLLSTLYHASASIPSVRLIMTNFSHVWVCFKFHFLLQKPWHVRELFFRLVFTWERAGLSHHRYIINSNMKEDFLFPILSIEVWKSPSSDSFLELDNSDVSSSALQFSFHFFKLFANFLIISVIRNSSFVWQTNASIFLLTHFLRFRKLDDFTTPSYNTCRKLFS